MKIRNNNMANPKSREARQAYIDKNPFKGLEISDNSTLQKIQGRYPCPQCGKSRKFFCYTCYVPIRQLEGVLPVLPIKIDIIKHKHEIDGKSTAGHAAILAPQDVSIHTYPDIPDYTGQSVVLIFPSQSAISVKQLMSAGNYECIGSKRHAITTSAPKGFNSGTLMKTLIKNCDPVTINNADKLPITKAIFIDSTWNQSKSIYKDDRIKRIPCVVIQNRLSQFWRHQKGSPRWYLATIEAIHQFLVELHINFWGLNPEYAGIQNCFTEETLPDQFYRNEVTSYKGQYDDLLYFFHHMYDLIHTYYDHDNLHAYKRRLM